MQRLLVRIAAVSLCAGALSACSIFGGSSDDNAMISPSGHDNGVVSVPADVNAAVHQARLLRLKGDTQGATRILSQLMLTAPDNADVVGEYGKLLVEESRADDAVQFLRRAVELQPNDWSLYSAMGVAYDQLNDSKNAKLAYEQALALKPGEAAILNNYAMSRMLAGDTVGAHALMARAQASGSNDPKIARNLALLDAMAPAKPAAPATQAKAVSEPPVPQKVVASAELPSIVPAAHHAPAPITRSGTLIVMQEIPVDVLAGSRRVHSGKPVKSAKARHVARHLALNTVKPVKKAKTAAVDQIPALRMTADATKP